MTKIYERRVNAENPVDLAWYWFEYDAGRITQITVIVVAVLMVWGLFKWVFR